MSNPNLIGLPVEVMADRELATATLKGLRKWLVGEHKFAVDEAHCQVTIHQVRALAQSVAEFTDPGWTPLFINAASLVLEVGGALTHGAVVAREYGIPAVVGVRQATHKIRSGQRLRVDGNRGMITLS